MSQGTLLFAASTAAASALVYGLVGFQFARRSVSEEAKEAQYGFAVWWGGLGALTFLGAIPTLMAAFGVTHFVFHIVVTYVALWVLCLALGGLLYYLVFVFTGSRVWLWPILGGYLALYLWLLFVISSANPVGVDVETWSTTLDYETPIADSVTSILLLVLIVPAIVGALGYLSLAFRLKAPEARFRAVAVPVVLIAWLGSSLVASALDLNENQWWPFISRFIGLFAAVLIYFAYDMPAWLQARLNPPGPEATNAAA
jgi:hypothetical protein